MDDFSRYTDGEEKSPYAEREEQILREWKEKNIFQKTLEKDAPNGEFVFYEGPPTANGRPGIHHLESRAFKDAIPRYKTMCGYHVRRKAGWDTHGLPVELEVEKELKLASKHDIEAYGIAEFNERCKESVWKYVSEWKDFTDRIGYWLDLDDPYVTYQARYMETLWWIFKQVAERDLLYKDYKVVPWCPRCGTGLSSHELAQGYRDVKDISITAAFELADEPGTYVLAWTTTPWTLPGNVALAVGEDISYVTVSADGKRYVVAADRLEEVFADREYEVLDTYPGSVLVGKTYKPLFPYFNDIATDVGVDTQNAYQIYSADFVTTEDGTGIVHTAVMYGQDDFELGTKMKLPKVHLVDESGKFIDGTGILAGRFVKETVEGKPTLDIDIIKHLQEAGYFFAKESYEHSYPHCWRCKTPLIYYARDSWYMRVSALKEQLLEENEKINWEPEHIKDGRFGEWLREVKDWAISRERYWGTPIPIWESESGERIVIGSVKELKEYATPARNTYYLIRHGQAENNVQRICSSNKDADLTITEQGRREVRDRTEELRRAGITKVISSPFKRALDTAKLVAEQIGLDPEAVVVDERLGEIDYGDFDGGSIDHFFEWCREQEGNYFKRAIPGGESFHDVKRRMGDVLHELEETYAGETILISSHGVSLEVLPAVAEAADVDRSFAILEELSPQNAEVMKLDFVPLPHNDDYELDLHRPYVDAVTLTKSGETFRRVREVADVWFDSGAVPFAQDHYPFESKEWIDGPGYPADFICEAIDQTRGWFYTLHAIGVLLNRGRAYRNVISLGHLLDAEGQKMSKSKGNTVDPWAATARYGADTLRFWMYSVNQPGEPKSFDEETVKEVQRKVFGLLDNVLSFYELYAGDTTTGKGESTHVLDRWITSRLAQTVQLSTEYLDAYKLLEPTRAIREFVADLSQWYIRRSRDRFKDETERAPAAQTTRYVLETLAKLLAPFAPFFAEDVYRRVGGATESVHLEAWPAPSSVDADCIAQMEQARTFITDALKVRQQEGIKVRQPLQTLIIPAQLDAPYLELIAAEVNVESVQHGKELSLDTTLTEELRRRGDIRELIRTIQSLRKEAGLTPTDTISLRIDTDTAGRDLIEAHEKEISAATNVASITFSATDGASVDLHTATVTASVVKE